MKWKSGSASHFLLGRKAELASRTRVSEGISACGNKARLGLNGRPARFGTLRTFVRIGTHMQEHDINVPKIITMI